MICIIICCQWICTDWQLTIHTPQPCSRILRERIPRIQYRWAFTSICRGCPYISRIVNALAMPFRKCIVNALPRFFKKAYLALLNALTMHFPKGVDNALVVHFNAIPTHCNPCPELTYNAYMVTDGYTRTDGDMVICKC